MYNGSNSRSSRFQVTLFEFGFICWFVINFLERLTLFSSYIPNSLFSGVRYFSLALIAIEILLTLKISPKTIIGIILVIISFPVSYFSKTPYIFDVSILILGIRNYNLKQIFQKQLIMIVFLTSLTIIACLIGILDNRIFYRIGERERYSFGFTYTTFLSQIIFFASMTYIYIKGRSTKIWNYLLLIILNVIVFYFTNTRNPFILSLFYIIVMFLVQKFHIFNRIFITVLGHLKYIFVLTSFISYYFSLTYTDTPFYNLLNTVLSNRLSLSKVAIYEWGIPFLGQQVEMFGGASFHYGNVSMFQEYNYVDSSYVQLLIVQGSLFFYLVIFLYTMTLMKVYKKGEYCLSFSLVLLSIHSIIDPQLLMVWYTPLVLVIGKLFVSDNHEL